MKKYLLLILLFVLVIPFVSSVQITTFNNSLSTENMSITEFQNTTRYLLIPNTVSFIRNASINLTTSFNTTLLSVITERGGSNNTKVLGSVCVRLGGSNDCTPTDTSLALRSDSGVDNHTVYFKFNMSGVRPINTLYFSNLSIYQEDSNPNSLLNATLFYSFNNSWNQTSITSAVSVPSDGSVLSRLRFDVGEGVYVFNINTSSPLSRINNFTNTNNLTTLILRFDNTVGPGSNTTFITSRNSNNLSRITPTLSLYYSTNYSNATLRTGNSLAWTDTGIGVEQSVDLVSYLNSYLSTCTYVNGNCSIPFNFYDSLNGSIVYSSLLVDNTGFQENSQSFNYNSFPNTEQSFSMNFTYDSSFYNSITPTLVYNNTYYSGVLSGSGNTRIASVTLTTPEVEANQNKTFYWLLNLTNSTTTTQYQSLSYQQNITMVSLDNCTSNTEVILNMTLYDEKTQVLATGNNRTIEIKVNITANNGGVLFGFNSSVTNSSNLQVCINDGFSSSSNISLNGIIRYEFDDHVSEFYNLQDLEITNNSIPYQINLYDIATLQSDSFLITVKDTTLLALSDALVDVQRLYIPEGIFKTVELAKTDTNGKTIIHLNTEDVVYRIVIKRYNEVLGTFDNSIATCESGVCEQNLNLYQSNVDISNWYGISGLYYNLYTNKTSRQAILDFISTDSSTLFIKMNITRTDSFGTYEVCQTNVTTSSGSINCVIPFSVENRTYVINIWNSNSLMFSSYFNLNPNATEIFGPTIIILAVMLIVTLVMMSLGSPIMTIIAGIVGVFVIIALNMINTGQIIGGGFLGGTSLVWICVAGGILIWKFNTRRDL